MLFYAHVPSTFKFSHLIDQPLCFRSALCALPTSDIAFVFLLKKILGLVCQILSRMSLFHLKRHFLFLSLALGKIIALFMFVAKTEEGFNEEIGK